MKNHDCLWFVRCDGYGTVWVRAENWELATVEAAKEWGVSWGEIAAECEMVQHKDALKNVCPSCGAYHHTGETICSLCQRAQGEGYKGVRKYAKRRAGEKSRP